MNLASNFHKRNIDVNDIMEVAQKEGVKQLDFKVINMWGGLYHMSMPAELLTSKLVETGIGFDGASVGGYARDHSSSDCRMKPDIETAFVDPFQETKTMSFLCDVVSADNPGQPHPFCPRSIARGTERYLRESFVGSKSWWSPELEFFLFNDVRFDIDRNGCFFVVDSKEGVWNNGANLNPNLGITLRNQGGYSIDKPFDQMADIRSRMVVIAQDLGIGIKVHHHEVASAAQSEIELEFDTLPNSADKVITLKYIIKNVAQHAGLAATFMPKPLYNENGSGMHLHQHFFQDNKPLFYDESGKFFKLSKWALSYIAGILVHAPALMAFTNATTNSYKRLCPGFEAPTAISFSLGDRTAAVRIPKYAVEAKSKRIEYRPPDASGNIYYSMSAVQLAGIDGVKKGLDPFKLGYDATDKKAKKMLPISLMEAMDALKKDHKFLTETGVFSEELIEIWIDKKNKEYLELERLPQATLAVSGNSTVFVLLLCLFPWLTPEILPELIGMLSLIHI